MHHVNNKDYSRPLRSTAERILIQLKTHGSQTSAQLGQMLAISSEAVRQQLQKLAVEELVCSHSQASGVGRPVLMWQLTAQGHQRFPDRHPALVTRLLEGIRQELGEAALEKVLAARHEETRTSYLQAMSGAPDLPARLERLALLRTGEGYMCEVQPQETAKTWLLVENHCPINVAAATCGEFCQAEIRLFHEVLGSGTHIERVEHMQEGARRCAYRISTSTILANPAARGSDAE